MKKIDPERSKNNMVKCRYIIDVLYEIVCDQAKDIIKNTQTIEAIDRDIERLLEMYILAKNSVIDFYGLDEFE